MPLQITGTGSAVPALCVTNDDLSKFLDTSDEWISTRTGIRERRIIRDETLTELACRAGTEAMRDAHVTAQQIDMLICATLDGDYITPSLSCLVAKQLNLACAHLFDLHMACSGFVFALDAAEAYLDAGKAERVLVICAEDLTNLTDFTDRSTCVLFGDGAGAVVVEKGSGMRAMKLTTDGDARFLKVDKTVGNCPYRLTKREQDAYIRMDGQEIFMFAVQRVIKDIASALEDAGLTADEVDYFLLHQANMRILETARKKLKQPAEKFLHNMEHYGNTSSASVPILLDESNKRGILKQGQTLVLGAFGAGLSSGVCVLRWTQPA